MQIGVETSRAIENKRVFIVHGDEVIRAALQFMLHDENEAHELATLEEAYRRGDRRNVDLMLLDVEFVRGGDADLLGQIAGRLPGVKVMLVAESPDDPTANACVEKGAHSVLAKPFKVEIVRRKTDAALGRTQKTAVALKVLG